MWKNRAVVPASWEAGMDGSDKYLGAGPARKEGEAHC